MSVTPRGVIALLLTIAVGVAAVLQGNNHLFLVFSALLAVEIFSAWVTWSSPRNVECSRLVREEASAGSMFCYTLRLRHAGRRGSAWHVQVHDELHERGSAKPLRSSGVKLMVLRSGEERTVEISVAPKMRGQARLGPIEVRCELPLGLFVSRREIPVEEPLLVLPRPALVRWDRLTSQMRSFSLPAQAFRRATGGDEELAGIREYRPEDPPRRIHWTHSVRIPGRWVVREWEQPRRDRVAIFLETSFFPRSDVRKSVRLDRAISFATGLAEKFLHRDVSVRFALLREGREEWLLQPGQGDFADLLRRLATLEPNVGASGDALMEWAAQAPEEGSIVVLLQAPPGPARCRARVLALGPGDIRAFLEEGQED